MRRSLSERRGRQAHSLLVSVQKVDERNVERAENGRKRDRLYIVVRDTRYPGKAVVELCISSKG